MSKKKVITQSLFVIGALAIGLFYLFDDPSSEAETSSSPLYHTMATYNGVAFPYKTLIGSTSNPFMSAEGMASTYRGYGGNLYIALVGNGEEDAYYSFYPDPPGCEGNLCWKKATELLLYSRNGVQAASATVSNTPLVCFFIKEGSYKVKHRCVTYQNYSVTAEASPLTDFKIGDLAFNNSFGLASIASSLTSVNKFYVTASNTASDNTVSIYAIECTPNATTGLNLNNTCSVVSQMSNGTVKEADPAIVVVPTESGEVHFTFYRKANDNINNVIHYYRSSNAGVASHAVPLTTIDGATNYKTHNRQGAYYYEGYVYLAWKKSNSTDIVTARIAAEDLLNEEHNGKGKWVYNDFKNLTDTRIAFTHTGPSLFEYADGLYLLWSDANDDDKVAYYEIDPVSFSNPVTIQAKGYLGHARADEDTIPDAFVTPDNQLYFLWAHGNQVAYSRWPQYDQNQEGYTWEGHTQTYGTVLKDDTGSIVTTLYGVETMFVPNVPPESKPMLCLFTKGYMTNEGQIAYRCSTSENYIGSLPAPTAFHSDMDLTNVYGLLSTTPSPTTDSKFLAVVSPGENSITDLQCDITKHDLEGDCIEGGPPVINPVGSAPSIIAIADTTGKERRFVFYRGESDNIYYRTAEYYNIVPMNNADNDSRETHRRPASYAFDGNIYVAWKNAHNEGIRFAKTSAQSLLSEDMAEGDWVYCELKNEHGNPITPTKGTPNLFEYNNRLYLLYVQYHEKNEAEHKKVSFLRIDDIVVGGQDQDVRCDVPKGYQRRNGF